MFSYNFTINKQRGSKNGFYPIRLIITYDSIRLRKTLKDVKTKIKDWDEAKQRILTNPYNEPENFADLNNDKIIQLEQKLIILKKEIGAKVVTFSEALLLERLFGASKTKYNNIFYDKYDEYVEMIKPPIKAAQTVKGFITCFNKIREFEKEKGYLLSFESINTEFYEKFRAYMFEDKKYASNYFVKVIATLKTFMS